jgi:TolB-like protein
VGIQFTDFDGPRIRLGVLKVNAQSTEPKRRDLADGIQELLTISLDNTKRFDLVEQERIRQTQEQQTGKNVSEPSIKWDADIGRILGAQYLVYAVLNEWHPGSRKDKEVAEISMTFILVDGSTGETLFTTSERARMGRARGLIDPEDRITRRINTLLGFATRACTNKAAFKIADFLKDRKWKGTVVEVKNDDAYINAGSQQGMEPLTKLSVQKVVGIIKDPNSDPVIDEDLRSIGTLEVVAVQPGFSLARIVQGCIGLKIGDRVELAPRTECETVETSRAR